MFRHLLDTSCPAFPPMRLNRREKVGKAYSIRSKLYFGISPSRCTYVYCALECSSLMLKPKSVSLALFELSELFLVTG